MFLTCLTFMHIFYNKTHYIEPSKKILTLWPSAALRTTRMIVASPSGVVYSGVMIWFLHISPPFPHIQTIFNQPSRSRRISRALCSVRQGRLPLCKVALCAQNQHGHELALLSGYDRKRQCARPLRHYLSTGKTTLEYA